MQFSGDEQAADSLGQRDNQATQYQGLHHGLHAGVCFYPLAAMCLCSPLLIVIPVTVHFSAVWETTRGQH